MDKTRIEISPIIKDQKIEIILSENSNDPENFLLHKYSTDGEKYSIKIPLNTTEAPIVLCEEGNKKHIKKVKNEVRNSIKGSKRLDLANELKQALSGLGIEETAYEVWKKAFDSISKYFGIEPDSDFRYNGNGPHEWFFNNRKYYLKVVRSNDYLALILSANVGNWKIEQYS